MKKLVNLFLLFCFTKIGAQVNLIPNPSFEEDTACPNNFSQIYKLKEWYSLNLTPDYFNKCYNGFGKYTSIPSNTFGYQNVANGCHSYAGLHTFVNPINSTSNEVLGVKLTSQLLIGTKYFLSLDLSLSNTSKRASNKFGASFSTTQPIYTFTSTPTNSAHITFTQTVSDTLNWVKLFGSFISTNNYEFISLGNFFDTLSFTRTYLYNELSPNIYYYIDNVCLTTDSAFAYDYNFNCLTTDLSEQNKNTITIYPNPAVNKLKYTTTKEIKDIELLDINFKNQKFIRREDELFFDVPHGVYFIKIVTNDDKIIYKKLILNQ
jgi:hypothetical protein